MEEALKRAHRQPRVLNAVEQSLPGEHAEPLLVNVLGTLTQATSLVLTEIDHEHLLWNRLPRASSEVVDVIHQMGRSFLFLGVSPRDAFARRLAHLLEVGDASMQGPCFFVSTEATGVDAAYWKPFNVQWIHEDPAEVVEALTAKLEAEAAP
jgi:hypothetical protein